MHSLLAHWLLPDMSPGGAKPYKLEVRPVDGKSPNGLSTKNNIAVTTLPVWS